MFLIHGKDVIILVDYNKGDMIMRRQFYGILGAFLTISIVLLGSSFASQSGLDNSNFLNEQDLGNVRVVYSDNFVNLYNKSVDVSVINRGDGIADYALVVEGLDSSQYGKVYYNVDGGETTVLIDTIVIDSIGRVGNDDYNHHKINFYFDEIIEFSIRAKYADEVNYGS